VSREIRRCPTAGCRLAGDAGYGYRAFGRRLAADARYRYRATPGRWFAPNAGYEHRCWFFRRSIGQGYRSSNAGLLATEKVHNMPAVGDKGRSYSCSAGSRTYPDGERFLAGHTCYPGINSSYKAYLIGGYLTRHPAPITLRPNRSRQKEPFFGEVSTAPGLSSKYFTVV
jgi:hypothetical protein